MIHSANLWTNRTVGLLGGSFNPAHEGHLHISLYALKMLRLDAVWWMVSPQNPLKSKHNMAPLKERLAGGKKMAGGHPRIFVTDIERNINTRYTADTIPALQARFPRTRFIWLMGRDNLLQIHRWQEWEKIYQSVPIAVLDRPPRSNNVKSCRAMERFRPYMLSQDEAARLKDCPPPAWTILHIPLNSQSATAIRERGKLRI